MRNNTIHTALLCAALAAPAAANGGERAATEPTTAGEAAWSSFFWGDLDADGKQDAVVLRPGAALRLLRNAGDGGFEDVTTRAGLEGLKDVRQALWQDFDGDGRSDLFLATPGGPSRLLRNLEGGFVALGEESGLPLDAGVYHAQWLDFDGDERSDLFLATSERDRLFRNLGDGRFEEARIDLPARPLAAPAAPAGPNAIVRNGRGADEDATAPPAGGPGAPGTNGPGGTSRSWTATPAAGGTQVAGSPNCALSVEDMSNPGSCVAASSVPTLGMLYPLGLELNIDGAGQVGIGTLTPGAQLDVVGDVRSSGRLISTAGSGAPLSVASTTLVPNLNADRLDGFDASAFSQLGISIEGFEITDGTITAADLAANSVGASEIAASAVGSSEIATGAVGSSEIADNSVAAIDIATDAVTSSEIKDGAIVAADLAANSVGSAAIANSAILDVDVNSAAAIQGTKISPNFGSQDIVTTGNAGIGTASPLADLDVRGSSTLATVMVHPTTGNNDAEMIFGEDSTSNLGMSLLYDGGSNLLQVFRRVSGTNDPTPHVAIERDSGKMSIGNDGFQQGQLTVNGTDDSLTPAIQVFGGPFTAVRGSSYQVGGATLYGEHLDDGTGVWGVGDRQGVYGQTNDPGGIGVFGYSNFTTSFSDGVWGHTENIGGYGMYARAEPSTGGGTGIYARTDSSSGWGVYASAPTGGSGHALYASGTLAASGTKSFVQPHPTDPSKQINFVCLEGNESGTYFRGSSRLIGGTAVIEVPEEFRLVSEQDGLTVQLTAVGAAAQLWIESKGLESIVVRGAQDVEFDYFVNGIRRGYDDLEIVRENTDFRPTDAGAPFADELIPELRQLLVDNGVLNPDFTPNEATAAALGWTLRTGEDTRAALEQRVKAERLEFEAREAELQSYQEERATAGQQAQVD